MSDGLGNLSCLRKYINRRALLLTSVVCLLARSDQPYYVWRTSRSSTFPLFHHWCAGDDLPLSCLSLWPSLSYLTHLQGGCTYTKLPAVRPPPPTDISHYRWSFDWQDLLVRMASQNPLLTTFIHWQASTSAVRHRKNRFFLSLLHMSTQQMLSPPTRSHSRTFCQEPL